MSDQDPSLEPTIEQSPAENAQTQLSELSPEAQEEFYQAWLDQTVPGRITAAAREALQAANRGDRFSEQALVMLAFAEMERAKDYQDRLKSGSLTPEEIAIRGALATLFPDKWPFGK